MDNHQEKGLFVINNIINFKDQIHISSERNDCYQVFLETDLFTQPFVPNQHVLKIEIT